MDLSDIPLNQGARIVIPSSLSSGRGTGSTDAGQFTVSLGGPRVGRRWAIGQVVLSVSNFAASEGFGNIASGHYDPAQLAVVFSLTVNNLDRVPLGEVVFDLDHAAAGSPNPGVDTYFFTGDLEDLAADLNNTLEIPGGGSVSLIGLWQFRPVKAGVTGYGGHSVAVATGNLSVTLKGRNIRG